MDTQQAKELLTILADGDFPGNRRRFFREAPTGWKAVWGG